MSIYYINQRYILLVMPKYKLKASKSIGKRFKITATGKFLRHKACRNHLLQKKSPNNKQKLRKVVSVKDTDIASLKLKIF